jgi:hypothetical protein
MRPTFNLRVGSSPDGVINSLRNLIDRAGGPFTGKVIGRHIVLTVRAEDRHFWSPWLEIEVTGAGNSDANPGAGNAAELRGRFTPHPSIWTGFAFSYLALIVLALFAGVWGLSQWLIDQRPTALWAALGCCVVMGLLWWSAQVGQRLARGKMEALREAVDGVVG